MATVLDFSVLTNFSIVFLFLILYIGTWGFLTLIDPFKIDNKGVYAVLAFALAFIILLSRAVVSIIYFTIPWMSLLMLVAFFLLFFAKTFDPDLPTDKLIRKSTVYGFLIFFAAVIVIVALANTFGQDLLEEQPGVSDADLIAGEMSPADTFVPADELEDPYAGQASISGNRSPRTPASGDIGSNIVLTLFHPKILGMLFMMLLAAVSILLLAKK